MSAWGGELNGPKGNSTQEGIIEWHKACGFVGFSTLGLSSNSCNLSLAFGLVCLGSQAHQMDNRLATITNPNFCETACVHSEKFYPQSLQCCGQCEMSTKQDLPDLKTLIENILNVIYT